MLLFRDTYFQLLPPLTYTSSCRTPYLLVTSLYTIYRIYPNGTGIRTLVTETSGGVLAVDCHYRYVCTYVCIYVHYADNWLPFHHYYTYSYA